MNKAIIIFLTVIVLGSGGFLAWRETSRRDVAAPIAVAPIEAAPIAAAEPQAAADAERPPIETDAATSTPATKEVTVNGHRLRVETVSSEAEITLGLGGRDSLETDHGMLFDLGLGMYTFWMKDMRFPIDIIWIRDGSVVDIAANMPAPKTEWEVPAIHEPAAEADAVLEINAGQAAAFGIVIGTKVEVGE